jgi:hypothetical protein
LEHIKVDENVATTIIAPTTTVCFKNWRSPAEEVHMVDCLFLPAYGKKTLLGIDHQIICDSRVFSCEPTCACNNFEATNHARD